MLSLDRESTWHHDAGAYLMTGIRAGLLRDERFGLRRVGVAICYILSEGVECQREFTSGCAKTAYLPVSILIKFLRV